MENIEQEFMSVIREYERVIYKVCYLYTTPNATLEYLYQLHTERKEHSGDCNPHTGSRPQRRGRRDTSHVTATLPDDKPAGATGKVYHPALFGREEL